MLNYGYGILEGEVWRAVHYAGLDPYGGFLHVDRPGRPSMVLDLMEEFRQQVVDKSVFALVAKNVITPTDFELVEGMCRLSDKARKALISEIVGKFESYVRVGDIKLRWCDLILKQTRDVAKYLRGELTKYDAFYLRW
jgi:CRISPR-associated protein Cas1